MLGPRQFRLAANPAFAVLKLEADYRETGVLIWPMT